MTVHKYAILTQIDENQYEVCYIHRFTENDEVGPTRLARIEDALLPGKVISGVPANNKPNVLIGSTWDGENFTLPNPIPERVIGLPEENGIQYKLPDGKDFSAYLLLSDNKVFMMMIPESGTFLDQKLSAAFTNNISLKKIDNDSVVSVGYTWDGTNFNPPA